MGPLNHQPISHLGNLFLSPTTLGSVGLDILVLRGGNTLTWVLNKSSLNFKLPLLAVTFGFLMPKDLQAWKGIIQQKMGPLLDNGGRKEYL